LRDISLNSHTVKEKEEGREKGMAIEHTDVVRNVKDKYCRNERRK
jgi:predicted transcriptional regulator